MDAWKIQILTVYALAGYIVNAILHSAEGVPMWTFDKDPLQFLPLSIIVDVVFAWVRILQYIDGFAFPIVSLLLIPFAFVVVSMVIEIIAGVSSIVR